jgi:hypothetical protein
MKSSFLIYLDYKEQFELLSDAELGQLLRAIMLYEETGEITELSGMLKMAFSFIKTQLDKDRQKYEEMCEKNRENAKKGGRPRKQVVNEKPNGFKENQTEAKKADNDKDNDNEEDIENEIEKDIDKKEKNKKRKTFDDVFSENHFSKDLQMTIKDFIDMRKTIKKPMTTKALELLIRNLEKLTNLEEEKIAILNQSIEHGWQTVYPLKTVGLQTMNNTRKGGMNDFKQLWEEARLEDEQNGNSSSNNPFSW